MFSRLSRAFIRLMVIVTVLAISSACGGGPGISSEGPVVSKLLEQANNTSGVDMDKIELRLWSFHQAREYDFWQELAEQYEAENPNVDIIVEFVTSDDYFSRTRLLSSFASGQGPDMFFVSPATIDRFVESDILYPLTSYFTKELRSDFSIPAIESVTVDGDIYAVPFETELLGLFYNKEMFRKAGMQPPSTWEDLRQAAERLSSSKISGLTVETYEGVYQNFSWLPFLWQTGSDLMREDGQGSAVADGEPEKMFTFFRGMIEDGLVNMKPSRPVTDIGILASGETAMQVSGTWNLRMLETEFVDQPIGVVPLPVMEGGEPITAAGGWKLAANKHSTHASEAARFIMWALAGDPSIPLRWVSDVKFAYSPRQSVMEAGGNRYREGLRAVFTDQIYGTEREEPQLPEEINRIFSDSLQQLIFGKATDPEALAAQAHERIEHYFTTSRK